MKLWIDDIRPMPKDFDVWAKSADEAVKILAKGNITHVSFDHDLGDVIETNGPIVLWDEHEKTGYDVAMWVEREAYRGRIKPFTYKIHSANPIGARKIQTAMTNAERFWNAN